ncbi:MAG: hypothetical protein ABIA92_05650 [Patescibacteria group bacterium]
MKLRLFQKKLSSLAFIPKQNRERALDIAESLSANDREELLEELREIDADLGTTTEEAEQFLDGVEDIIDESEKTFLKLDREEKEENEQKTEIAKIERILTQDTSSTTS